MRRLKKKLAKNTRNITIFFRYLVDINIVVKGHMQDNADDLVANTIENIQKIANSINERITVMIDYANKLSKYRLSVSDREFFLEDKNNKF